MIQFYAFMKTGHELSYEKLIELAKEKIKMDPQQVKNFNEHFKGLFKIHM